MKDQQGFISGIRLKVFIGFGVALLALGFAGMINFIALNRLVDSAKTLSQPNEKLISVNRLLDYLSDEENAIRSFALTRDDQYLSNYHQFSDSVHLSLTQLKRITFDNEREAVLADSIQQLVAEREGLMNQFIEKRKTAFGSQKAGSIPVGNENSKAAVQKNQPTEITAPPDSAEAKKNKGFGSWIKNIFSPSDKKPKNKKGNENNLNEQDDAAVPPAQSSEKTSGGKDVTANLESEEAILKKQMQEWSFDEAVMMQHDKNIMDRIRSKISLVEGIEQALTSEQAAISDKQADNANRIMVFVGILGILSTLIFIYLILSDVARSNLLRSQLVEERKRAEKLAKVKEEFLANMSHEIRTPLNSIIGFADQLAKEKQDEKQQVFTRAIQQSSNHLLLLVNQILDFSKIESGKQIPENAPFDFHQLIREVYETFKLKAAEKKIEFTFSVDDGVPQFVQGDALWMKQILINLVSNALKFTEQGGVSIHCTPEENGFPDAELPGNQKKREEIVIRTEVKDSGIGFAPEMRHKIFEEFTQRDYSITRKFGGTGLGLTITKKLTEILKGKIEVSSKEGTGSIFTVIIPFKTCDVPIAEVPETLLLQDILLLHDKRVLVVDDEEMNVLLCKTILEKWGIITDSARDGQEALQKFQHAQYDLILLDLQMPVMSGMEAARQLRNSKDPLKKQVPLIALTANVYSSRQDEIAEAGFNDVLIKPFREETLYRSIQKLLIPQKTKSDELKPGVQNTLQPETQDNPSYSLEYLEKTSGSNQAFIISMVQSFITNNEHHLQLLDDALVKKDWNEVCRLAHKMIPSYRYLGINETEGKLKLLEEISGGVTNPEKIRGLIKEIRFVTEKLFVLLRVEIQKLQQANGKPVTQDALIT